MRHAFVTHDPEAQTLFTPAAPGMVAGTAGKWRADLAGLARQRLAALGISQVYGNDSSPRWCTVGNPSRFFSYRRDGVTGRLGASIWRALFAPRPSLRGRQMGASSCRLPCLDGPLACRCAHQIHHQRHRPQPVEHKGDDGAEHGAVGVGGFGHCHHQCDIKPGDGNDVHDEVGLERRGMWS